MSAMKVTLSAVDESNVVLIAPSTNTDEVWRKALDLSKKSSQPVTVMASVYQGDRLVSSWIEAWILGGEVGYAVVGG